jgi:hypothetical protein
VYSEGSYRPAPRNKCPPNRREGDFLRFDYFPQRRLNSSLVPWGDLCLPVRRPVGFVTYQGGMAYHAISQVFGLSSLTMSRISPMTGNDETGVLTSAMRGLFPCCLSRWAVEELSDCSSLCFSSTNGRLHRHQHSTSIPQPRSQWCPLTL